MIEDFKQKQQKKPLLVLEILNLKIKGIFCEQMYP